jgi:hypothetical protein
MVTSQPTLDELSSKKRSYHKPVCTPYSSAEASRLLAERTLRSKTNANLGAGPVLLVTEYSGDATLSEETARNAGMQCHQLSLVDGVHVLYVMLNEVTRSTDVHTGLFLLDLRDASKADISMFERISNDIHLGGSALAILGRPTISLFNDRLVSGGCWQLCGLVSPAMLAKALKSFLQLCGAVTETQRQIIQQRQPECAPGA